MLIKPVMYSKKNMTLVGNGPYFKKDLKYSQALAPYVVAVDGGANSIHNKTFKPKLVVGDMDSISQEILNSYKLSNRYNFSCQETTDFEKCLELVRAPLLLGVGFLGGRLDHQLANLSSLVKFPNQKCILIGSRDICFLSPSEFSINLPVGTVISLFPVGLTSGSSHGLKYSIDNLNLDPTKKIGTSNEVVSEVSLKFNERVVLIILSKIEYLLKLKKAYNNILHLLKYFQLSYLFSYHYL